MAANHNVCRVTLLFDQAHLIQMTDRREMRSGFHASARLTGCSLRTNDRFAPIAVIP
jgi:hypothetical protein